MKMWSMKVIMLLLFCYARPLTGKVYFTSQDFHNVLHWDPVNSASPEEKVLYSVQYKSDAMDEFQIKKECHNITALSCDLTAETVSIYDIQYEARVFFNSSHYWKTKRFKPIADTTFGPPSLFIYTTVSSLHIDVTLPEGPNGISIADIINRSTNGHSKNIIIYTLNITEPKWAALVNKTTSGRFVISLNNNQREYCGHVYYKTLSEWGRSNSQNASFCATLPGDHRMLLPWLLISAALLVAVITMLVVYMYNYAKGGKQKAMPPSLVTTFPTQHKIMQSPDEKLNVYEAQVCTPKTVYTTIVVMPQVPSIGNGGYSPQDIILQTCTGSSEGTDDESQILNPQDTSAQSSDIYGAVVVHVPNENNEDIQQATTDYQKDNNPSLSVSGETRDKGGMSPTLVTLHGLDATETNSARPLMLHTVRNPNGQLMLSSPIFQLQSDTGDEELPFPSERKPLLSDLIDNKMEGPSLASLQSFDISDWSDSGCDESTINTPTIYSPSQATFHQGCPNTPSCDVMFESAYKQNWIPEMLLGTAVKDNCEYKKNYP